MGVWKHHMEASHGLEVVLDTWGPFWHSHVDGREQSIGDAQVRGWGSQGKHQDMPFPISEDLSSLSVFQPILSSLSVLMQVCQHYILLWRGNHKGTLVVRHLEATLGLN